MQTCLSIFFRKERKEQQNILNPNNMKTRPKVVIYSSFKDMESMNVFAESKNYSVIETLEKSDDPFTLSDLMDYLTFNEINKVLVPTCSTLTRKPIEFMTFVNDLNEAGISLVVFHNNIESLKSDGEINPSFSFLLNVWKEFDTIQKQQTRERLEMSYNRFRFRGGRVGRKEGYRKKELQYKKEYRKEIDLLRAGLSLKHCKNETGTSINTLRKLKKMFVYGFF